MTSTEFAEPTPPKPLRLWPGVVAVVIQWLAWLVLPVLVPGVGAAAFLAAVAAGAIVLLWWLFFSRAPWLERLVVLVLMVVAVIATKRVVHPSIANGAMGMLLFIYAIPALCLALVAALVGSRRLSSGGRRAAIAGAIVVACGAFTLLRTGGISGDGESDLHWRWTKTPEERLLAQGAEPPASPVAPRTAASPAALPAEPSAAPPTAPAPAKAAADVKPAAPDESVAPPPTPTAAPKPEWPGFRGAGRDGVAHTVRIATDWTKKPPVEMWRRPIGPAWSSFAVKGDFLYTQEQRGEEEIVACYRLGTGEQVWRHGDAARFWESNAGAGPRATPTLHAGRVYTVGGTGIVNALDARDGSVIWSRNAIADTGGKVPGWGIASSPLVVGEVVIAAPNGWLVGYEADTGEPRWQAERQGGSYSSPHLATIDGVTQVVLLTGAGVMAVQPSDGTVLWKHARPGDGIVQPAVLSGGDVLLGSGSGLGADVGMRRVAIRHGAEGWAAEERWTSIGLKPYFNDFVVHEGHAFGFDGSILACIGLEDGQRKWKGGRYGHGQLVLLPEQDLLLVLSEEGELALVRAAPDQHTELARVRAIEGKTWNHPVLVGDVLVVRNGEEMAAFRLPVGEP